jgi:hypothetical protein
MYIYIYIHVDKITEYYGNPTGLLGKPCGILLKSYGNSMGITWRSMDVYWKPYGNIIEVIWKSRRDCV